MRGGLRPFCITGIESIVYCRYQKVIKKKGCFCSASDLIKV